MGLPSKAAAKEIQWTWIHVAAVVVAAALGWIGGQGQGGVNVTAPTATTPSPRQPNAMLAPATSTGLRECDPDGLLDWLREEGAIIHPALRVCRSQTGGREVCAAAAIPAGETLFNVPDSLALTSARTWARIYKGKEKAASVTPPAPGSLRTLYLRDDRAAIAHTMLAAALVVERRLGSTSPFAQYLACLPAVPQCPTLPCFTPAERAALDDPYAAEVGDADRRALLRALRAALRRSDVDADRVAIDHSEAELLWAFGMVTSRSFVVDGVPRLLPFVDMLNHHPAAGGIDVVTQTNGAPSLAWKKLAAMRTKADRDRSKRGLDGWDSGGGSNAGGRGAGGAGGVAIAAGATVRWAYKRAATPFDLLYLYGFVDDTPGEASVAVDLQWDPPSPAARQTALLLFQSIDRSMVAELPSPAPSGPLKISLVFAEAGLVPATLGYARVVALAEQLAKGTRAARSAAREAAAAAAAGTKLLGPSDARPLGAALEVAALQTLLGLAGPPDQPSGPGPVGAGQGHGGPVGGSGAGGTDTARLAAARAFRRRRARVMEATRRAAAAAHSKAKAAVEPAPIDYFADF